MLVDPTRIAAYGVDVVRLRELLESSEFLGERRRDHREQLRFIVRPLGEFRSSTTCATS